MENNKTQYLFLFFEKDTAGQERFKSMTPMYYRGAAAAILVYDITNPKSFEAVQDWVNGKI